MGDHVCSWRHAYLFDNVFRRLLYNPTKLFAPYVDRGMTAMDVGCGMGYNAIGLARLVGDEGRVLAIDLQQEMLDVLMRRARRAGVEHRIHAHRCPADTIGLDETVDFVVAFWAVHELPDAGHFFAEARDRLRTGGKLLVAEPSFHVSKKALQETIRAAEDAGLTSCDAPRVRGSRTALLNRP